MHALAEWFFVCAFTLTMVGSWFWWRAFLASPKPKMRTIKWKQVLRYEILDSLAGKCWLN